MPGELVPKLHSDVVLVLSNRKLFELVPVAVEIEPPAPVTCNLKVASIVPVAPNNKFPLASSVIARVKVISLPAVPEGAFHHSNTLEFIRKYAAVAVFLYLQLRPS